MAGVLRARRYHCKEVASQRKQCPTLHTCTAMCVIYACSFLILITVMSVVYFEILLHVHLCISSCIEDYGIQKLYLEGI